jgi:hypothetical protein
MRVLSLCQMILCFVTCISVVRLIANWSSSSHVSFSLIKIKWFLSTTIKLVYHIKSNSSKLKGLCASVRVWSKSYDCWILAQSMTWWLEVWIKNSKYILIIYYELVFFDLDHRFNWIFLIRLHPYPFPFPPPLFLEFNGNALTV